MRMLERSVTTVFKTVVVNNHNTMQYCNLDKKNNEEDELVTVMVS